MTARAARPQPPEHLALARYLAADVRLLRMPAMTLKCLLVLEHLRPRGSAISQVEIPAMAAWLGTKPGDVRQALSALPDAIAALRLPTGEWHPFAVAAHEDVDWVSGAGGLATVRFSRDWLGVTSRDVAAEVPFEEVAALTTRTGLLLRLRAAGLLAGRGPKAPRPHMVYTDDWEHYTGHGGVGSPATILRQYLVPGLADVERHCPSVAITADTVHSAGPQARLRGMRLSVRKSVVRRARVPAEAA